uniref:Unannotated protein n=1 Tax=freshwater metagenome TaxID=449393 RepID=A0A6J7PBT6_9ZZZZ
MARAAVDRDGRVAVRDGVLHAHRLVELGAELVKVNDLKPGALLDRALDGRELAEHEPQQRRLAGAVRSDDPDDPGLGHLEREVLDEQAVTESLGHPVELDHGVTQTRSRRDHDLERAVVLTAGLCLGLELVICLKAGLTLGLPGLGGHAHPLELALQGALTGRLLLLLLGESGALLLEPARVVALEREATAAVEFEDPLGHVVEEVAVVGDGDDGAGVVLQEALQPVDALGVEVVGGLVEQEQIRAGEQQATQGNPASLATGERGHVGVVGWAPKGVHGDLDVALEVPGVGDRDLVLEVPLQCTDFFVVSIRVGPHGHDLVVALDEVTDLGDPIHHVAEHVLGGVQLGLLLEQTDREARGEAGLAGEAVVEAGHDLKQAGLARAVGPDDSDLGAGVERERDVLEHHLLRRVEATEFVHRVDELVSHSAPTLAVGIHRGVRSTV